MRTLGYGKKFFAKVKQARSKAKITRGAELNG